MLSPLTFLPPFVIDKILISGVIFINNVFYLHRKRLRKDICKNWKKKKHTSIRKIIRELLSKYINGKPSNTERPLECVCSRGNWHHWAGLCLCSNKYVPEFNQQKLLSFSKGCSLCLCVFSTIGRDVSLLSLHSLLLHGFKSFSSSLTGGV